MRCPILPVGPGVTTTLPVDTFIVDTLRIGLQRRGYALPPGREYTPELAQLIYRFQQDHLAETGVDLGVSIGVRGPNGQPLGIASCATYQALGVPCEGVDCVASIWAPLLRGGQSEALTLCLTVHGLAQAGVFDLDCPTPPTPPPPPPPPPPGEAVTRSPWLLIGGVALLALLSGRRRS